MPNTSPTSTMRRDIGSAYLLTASRIFGWILVSALVYRKLGAPAFALLTLVRSTVGLLSNTSLGLAPAMISRIAKAIADTGRQVIPQRQQAVATQADLPLIVEPMPLSHASPRDVSVNDVYSNGLALALCLAIIGIAASVLYGAFFTTLHRVPIGFRADELFVMAGAMGVGITLRMISDAPAAVLQTTDHIALDNFLLAGAEILWVVLSALAIAINLPLMWVGVALLVSNLALVTTRLLIAGGIAGRIDLRKIDRRLIYGLLAFGSMIAIAELADFLYAPTDYILINRLLSPEEVAVYAPAVQFDGALLLMVSAVAEVLLPKTALAHHAGDRHTVRKYYIVGTLATASLLAVLSFLAWLIAPAIFRFWLGQKLYNTRAILPLVLIHTVIGGSSAVGRAIFLGMGKVKAFTTAVILSGAANVILSFCFVRYLHLGLPGIVYGTICAVVGRCALWMPWYVSRTLRSTWESHA